MEAALDVLRNLQTNHSLGVWAKRISFSQPRSIQQIFARIHVPQDLSLSNLMDCKLTRSGSPREADLTQISTGQESRPYVERLFDPQLIAE